ncbi:caspase recruitment domain-containing protein 19 isoform X5 [Alligator mississippiensis]|uniref:caspase recruitment domain-containing protein 19 isoform X5 n=1 Tax=Alligator mississippiensis TaxID=8496 RepID=UPI002877CAAF|nr:caspase recruitment domain-containing protein 19 isoform X5 [Alligator mississippiensis]
MMLYRTYQSYCDRLRQDMYFLTSNGRLSELLVDKIILQLNRVYPQILTNKEAEKIWDSERVVERGPERDNISERNKGLTRDSTMTPTEVMIVQFFVMNVILCICVFAGYYLIRSLEDELLLLTDFVFANLVSRTIDRAMNNPDDRFEV